MPSAARFGRGDRGRTRWRRALGLLAGAGALCVACAGVGDPGSHGTTSPTPAPSIATPTPTPTPTDLPDPADLVWSDEFDGDLSKWYADIDANEWTTRDVITDRPENLRIENGDLVITVRHEPWADLRGTIRDYTSSRIASDDAFLYGRIEARLKAPVGKGFWSAFWLLGVGSWPEAGEIDMVELLSDTMEAYTSAHGVRADGSRWDGVNSVRTATGEPWGDSWHVYAVDWSPDAMVFLIDGAEVHRFTPASVEPDSSFWSFNHPAQIILSLATGAWQGFPGGGMPDETTPFPGDLRVDWVRVYGSTVTPSEQLDH